VTDGLASAVQQARAVAGGKDVAIAGGGSIVRQPWLPAWSTSWSCTSPPSSSARDSGCSTPAWVSVAALPFRAGRAIRAVGR
jgi:hypothetical protein